MIKHCKYSKTKEVKPYELSIIIYRYDGNFVRKVYFATKEGAEKAIEFDKQFEQQPNEFYFKTEYKIKYIGEEKLIL